MWKVNKSTWHEHATKRNSGSWQESNPWPPEHRASDLSTELRKLMESNIILTAFICDRRPLMSSRSSVDRSPAGCSGGHGFDSCWGLRIPPCPILVSCRLIHLLQAHICHMKDRAMPDMIHVSLHGRAAKQAILIIITGDDNYLTRPKWQRKPRQKDTKTTAV